jgi:hypothetical protein
MLLECDASDAVTYYINALIAFRTFSRGYGVRYRRIDLQSAITGPTCALDWLML